MYKKELLCEMSYCDFEKKISIYGYSLYAENIFSEYFKTLNLDGIILKEKYDAMWVFTKSKFVILKNIYWSTHFVIECFVKQISLVKLVIEIAFKVDNQICAVCDIELCALGAQKFNILKLSSFEEMNKIKVEKAYLDSSFVSIEKIEDNHSYTHYVNAMNLDLSMHMNNTEYIKLILSSFSVDELIKFPIKQFQINYLGQVHENDVISVAKVSSSSGYIINLYHADKVVVSAKIDYRTA